MVTVKDVAEILVNVVPITKEDDRIHNYQVPSDDCFAHLEVQFRFFALSQKVDGVLGRTYRLDFENPAKPGVAMPVVGGEDKYRTNSLLSPDCVSCVFSQESSAEKETMEYGTLDCTKFSNGLGIFVIVSLTGWGVLFYIGYKFFTRGKGNNEETIGESNKA
ncbi:hypothetical protein JHK87_037472 [Glycine soja]|nr:hypothetical protein JHK87_037472 [Glycine soja]